MTWHDLIREARERANLSQAELAEKVGCSQATINKIENDKPQSSKFLIEIINQLGLSSANFPAAAFGNLQSLAKTQSTLTTIYGRNDDPSIWAIKENLIGEIPVYAPIQFIDDIYSIDRIIVGTTKRPPFLQGVAGAYALSTDDESMSPECEPGDILYVNPRQIILLGSLCAFYSNVEGEIFVDIKRYVGVTENSWKAVQHNPHKEVDFAKDVWPVRHRIVGKIFR